MEPEFAVIGGTYREACVEPFLNRIGGSGLRAAGIARSLGRKPILHTRIDPGSASELESTAQVFGFDSMALSREHEITFAYQTPVSPPRQFGTEACEDVAVDAEVVVGFGMVESTWTARARTAIVDPQHGDLARMLARVQADRVAVVLNEAESRRQTGLSDVEKAATALISDQVSVVVIKQGALGGLVATADTVALFGAIPTAIVQPIGSGDAFTAGFAHAWAGDPSDLPLAVEAGARAAALHSIAGIPQINGDLAQVLTKQLPRAANLQPRVYLAGPFFSLAQRQFIQLARAALRSVGAAVFSPIDDVGPGGDDVASGDLAGLRSCGSVFAWLDGADPGTLFETGWATQLGIPVVGFCGDVSLHDWTMLRGTGVQLFSDLATAVYASAWAALADPMPT